MYLPTSNHIDETNFTFEIQESQNMCLNCIHFGRKVETIIDVIITNKYF